MIEKIMWYEVYDELAQSLYDFYINEENTGNKLYRRVYSSIYEQEFIHKTYFGEFNWIKKFKEWKVDSLDPIHVFASFNYYKIHKNTRVNIINFYFRILEKNIFYEEDQIDFSGIPSPRIDYIVGARRKEQQDDIWIFFKDYYKNKKENRSIEFLGNSDIFNQTKKWFGIAIPSITIFLFWIDSDNIIPLDRNTVDFLEYKKIPFPSTLSEYINLLNGTQMDIRKAVKRAYTNRFRELKFNLMKDVEEYPDLTQEDKLKNEAIYDTHEDSRQNIVLKKERVNYNFDYKLQILGIKPLGGCREDILKSLNEEVYSFNDFYEISDCFIEIKQQNHSMYDIDNLQININAIVGKNGTGKSTIVELLICTFNNISKELNPNLEIEFIKNLNVELFIFLDKPYKFKLYYDQENNKNTLKVYEYKKIDKNKYEIFEEENGEFNLGQFFYTVLLNYSLYGLNELNNNEDWVHGLFHKNDAYQTPIVIEPFRSKGNIDVNKQSVLLHNRLLSTILEKSNRDKDIDEPIEEFRKLTDYQFADKLNLSLNKKKINNIIYDEENRYDCDFADFGEEVIAKTLENIYRVFNIENFNTDVDLNINFELENILKLYIFKKLVVMAYRYEPYKNYFKKEEKQFLPNTTKEKISIYNKLFKDSSHITYKVKQAIYFLKYINNFKEIETFDEIKLLNGEILEIDIDDISDKVYISMTSESNININPFVLPSIFDIKIITNDNNNFNTLSSGEQQIVYVVNSIMYQLKNLASVDETELIKYRHVTVFLEEIELYFHPEMQRKFLNHLREKLITIEEKSMLTSIKSINLFFITHSPFILSDIPSMNIMLLDRVKNEVGKYKTIQMKNNDLDTFGANIHELLGDAFFLCEGSIGEFALSKISTIVSFYKRVIIQETNNKNSIIEEYLKRKEEFYFIRDFIGEKYIRGIISNHIEDIEKILNIKNKSETLEEELYRLRKENKELQAKVSHNGDTHV